MEKVKCASCGSKRIVKGGFRHNESGDKQLFLCRKCGRKFVTGLKKYRHEEKVMRKAARMHNRGMSLAEVQIELRKRGVNVSRWTISKWSRVFS